MKNGEAGFDLVPIGVVRSPIMSRKGAPRQGFAGGVEAWVELDPRYEAALLGIRPGVEVVLVTWLHQAVRDVLQVYPKSSSSAPASSSPVPPTGPILSGCIGSASWRSTGRGSESRRSRLWTGHRSWTSSLSWTGSGISRPDGVHSPGPSLHGRSRDRHSSDHRSPDTTSGCEPTSSRPSSSASIARNPGRSSGQRTR